MSFQVIFAGSVIVLLCGHLVCCSSKDCDDCSCQVHDSGMEIYLTNQSCEDLSCLLKCNINNMGAVKTLNLSHNRFRFLQKSVFNGFTSLEVLDLSHNRLLTLPDDQFTSLRHLREVYLQHNQLGKLDLKMFHDLQNLIFIDLEQNSDLFVASSSSSSDDGGCINGTVSVKVDIDLNGVFCDEPSTARPLTTLLASSSDGSSPTSASDGSSPTSSSNGSSPTSSSEDTSHTSLSVDVNKESAFYTSGSEFVAHVAITAQSFYRCIILGSTGLVCNIITVWLLFRMRYTVKWSLVRVG